MTINTALALLPPQQLQRWRDDLLQQRRQGPMPRDVFGDAQHALGQGLTWQSAWEKGGFTMENLWISMDFCGCRMIYVENLWISVDVEWFMWRIYMDFRWIYNGFLLI